jgi:hypothetical protein
MTDGSLLNFLILVIVLILLYLQWSKRKPRPNPGGGGGQPPGPDVKQVAIRKDPVTGRWQLKAPNGELAGPIIVGRGDIITWENATAAQVDFQFPSDVLFTLDDNQFPGGRTIDPWIVTIAPGEKLQTMVSDTACVSSYPYAAWVREDSSVTGYVQSGSPPQIIVKKA